MADLPKAVQAAEARADEILKKDGAGGETQKASTTSDAMSGLEEKLKPSSEPAGVTPKPPTEDKGEDYWERRCKSLQGIFDKHRTDSEAELRQRDAALEKVQGQVSELEGRLEEAVAKASAPDPSAFDEFTPAAKEAIEKLIEDGTRKDLRIAELMRGVAQLQESHQTTNDRQEVLAEDSYMTALENGIPDLQAINKLPEFEEYMFQVPPEGVMYGETRTRQALLEEAHGNLDAARVIAIYNGFKASAKSLRSAAPAPSPIPTGAPDNPDPGSQDKPTYSVAEWNALKKKVAMSRRLSDTERDELEREMFSAAAEGRVRGLSPP